MGIAIIDNPLPGFCERHPIFKVCVLGGDAQHRIA